MIMMMPQGPLKALSLAMGMLFIPIASGQTTTIAEIFENPTRYDGMVVHLTHVVATDGLPEPWFKLTDIGLHPWSAIDMSKKEICIVGGISSTHPMPTIMNITAKVGLVDGYPYLKEPDSEG
jgi:hypothetical protein